MSPFFLYLGRLSGLPVPSATLTFDPAELEVYGVRSSVRPLRGRTDPGTHDPRLLRFALDGVIGSPAHRAS